MTADPIPYTSPVGGYVTARGTAVFDCGNGVRVRTHRADAYVVLAIDGTPPGDAHVRGTTSQGIARARQIARTRALEDRRDRRVVIMARDGDRYTEVAS